MSDLLSRSPYGSNIFSNRIELVHLEGHPPTPQAAKLARCVGPDQDLPILDRKGTTTTTGWSQSIAARRPTRRPAIDDQQCSGAMVPTVWSTSTIQSTSKLPPYTSCPPEV
jgi:hypothetical protein